MLYTITHLSIYPSSSSLPRHPSPPHPHPPAPPWGSQGIPRPDGVCNPSSMLWASPGVHREAPRLHPDQMPEPHQLASFYQCSSIQMCCPYGWGNQIPLLHVCVGITLTWGGVWAAWRSSESCGAPGWAVWPTRTAAWWRGCGPLCWISGRTASKTCRWERWPSLPVSNHSRPTVQTWSLD